MDSLDLVVVPVPTTFSLFFLLVLVVFFVVVLVVVIFVSGDSYDVPDNLFASAADALFLLLGIIIVG